MSRTMLTPGQAPPPASLRRRARAVVAPTAVTALVSTDLDPPHDRAREVLAAHPEPRTHRVARCRWCQGPFVWIYGTHWLCQTPLCAARQLHHAIARPGGVTDPSPWLFVPLPVNVELIESPRKRTLIAGSAGASKSYGARWLIYVMCLRRPGLSVILTRNTYDELQKNHLNFMPAETAALGCAQYRTWPNRHVLFDNGSRIAVGYCDKPQDEQRFLGGEFDLCVIEEATLFAPSAIAEITARDRGSSTVAHEGDKDGKSWLLSNPGGRGMLFLYDHYIIKSPDPEEFPAYNASVHGYIPANITDNPYLGEMYADVNLSGLSRARYEQLRNGDWTMLAGQFFDVGPVHVQALDPPIGGTTWTA